VTAAALAHVNRLPVLFIAGDVFACRRPDPSDRRAGLVSLTPDGHALVGRTRTRAATPAQA